MGSFEPSRRADAKTGAKNAFRSTLAKVRKWVENSKKLPFFGNRNCQFRRSSSGRKLSSVVPPSPKFSADSESAKIFGQGALFENSRALYRVTRVSRVKKHNLKIKNFK